MHSFGLHANVIITFSLAKLKENCSLASSNNFNTPSLIAKMEVLHPTLGCSKL
ncbi:signal peptidase complex subunit 3 [Dendrobium catenatum]|uniref:Signal peptidase complex subunit 3 n=1 Tax=Dendrobium catenatum TaxID=906689 RepID=A0A2I0VV35_9ASPA|nr:signal peptidase complex subunit 3 [Dendrobium catenatum]